VSVRKIRRYTPAHDDETMRTDDTCTRCDPPIDDCAREAVVPAVALPVAEPGAVVPAPAVVPALGVAPVAAEPEVALAPLSVPDISTRWPTCFASSSLAVCPLGAPAPVAVVLAPLVEPVDDALPAPLLSALRMNCPALPAADALAVAPAVPLVPAVAADWSPRWRHPVRVIVLLWFADD
jgi:hypothetical protein